MRTAVRYDIEKKPRPTALAGRAMRSSTGIIATVAGKSIRTSNFKNGDS
jgi:hypothetical protein